MHIKTIIKSMAAIAVLASASAFAAYPEKPVKLIVPYPPGGPTDIISRVVANQLTEQTGQSYVVENRPGAGGNIGAEAAARAPADGYTVLVLTTAHVINPWVMPNNNLDLLRDFKPVSLMTTGPLVVAVNPSLPVHDIKELISYAKKNGDKLNYGSSGNGQSTHLSAELFKSMAGIEMTHIPYQGSAPAITAAIGGQVQVIFDPMLSVMPFVRGGKLRALAVTSAERSPAAPEIPTVKESGLPDYDTAAFFGVAVPAGTPDAVVEKLNQEIRVALKKPNVQKELQNLGFMASWNTPAEFTEYLRKSTAAWGKAVKDSGASAS